MAYVFLCGSDMDPVAIRERAAFDEARIESIGSVAEADAPGLPGLDGRVWGIVLRTGAMHDTKEVPVVLRDGREVSATVASTADEVADRAAVIAQARYWELPVTWWKNLSET